MSETGKNNTGSGDQQPAKRIAGTVGCAVAGLCALASVAFCGVRLFGPDSAQARSAGSTVIEDAQYGTKEDVASYIHQFGHLPPNYVTKLEAELAGWEGGSLESIMPGFYIGGDRFYEEFNPRLDIIDITGRYYMECDVNSEGLEERSSERLLYSNDGMVYYTPDHYRTLELLYSRED